MTRHASSPLAPPLSLPSFHHSPRVVRAQPHAVAARDDALEVGGADDAAVADRNLVALPRPRVDEGEGAGAAARGGAGGGGGRGRGDEGA